jgi:trans-aconitate methyltransferase
MDKYQETFETWNKIASLYEERFMHLDIYDETYDFFCASITQKSASLFEIGCGPGNITSKLLRKRPDFDIFGIDVAPSMVELASKNNPTAQFEAMDCRAIGTMNQRFDGIVCGFCIPYLSTTDVEVLLSQCARLLHAGGMLYLSFVDGNSAQSGFQVGSSGDRAYFYFHRLEDITQQLHLNGFSIVNRFEVAYPKKESNPDYHTIIIATT